MLQEILYLSTERTVVFLQKEIKDGIKTVKELKGIHRSISIRSISIKAECGTNGTDDCIIADEVHSLEKDFETDSPSKEDSLSSEEEEFHFNDFYKLAEHLHEYSDTNLKNAATCVHVLWCVKSYVPCPSEVVEFYGCLERFIGWHNASLSIVTNTFEAVEDWIAFLPLQVVNSSQEVIRDILSTLWRGSLSFSVKGKNGFTSYPDVVLHTGNKNSSLLTLCGLKEASGMQYVLPTAEVFTEVDINSIPWSYIQKGSLCSLSPSPFISEEDKAEVTGVLEHLASDSAGGVLFRIRYSSSPPSIHGLDDTSTLTWKRLIAEGTFNLQPSSYFEGKHDVVVFLILPNGTNDTLIRCVALQDPTLYGEDIVKLILQEQLKKPVDDQKTRSNVMHLLNETIMMTPIQVCAISHLFLYIPDTIKQGLEKRGQCLDKIWDDSKLALECCTSKEILLQLFSQHRLLTKIKTPDFTSLAEIDVPKERWPEYEALEEREKKKAEALIRCTSGDFLCGLPPPISTRNAIGTNITELLKCFDERSNLLDISDGAKKKGLRNMDFTQMKVMSWRDSLHSKFHGIHYNNSEQQEKRQMRRNKIIEQTIRSETASTCSVFQNSDCVLSTSTKNKLKLNNSNRKLELPARKPFVGKHVFDGDSSSVVSSVKSSRYRDVKGMKKPRNSLGALSSKPLRRSPRKHQRDEDRAGLKPSDLFNGKPVAPKIRKSAGVSRVNPTPADLSEVHKQKLRNVVLYALESEGVKMKDRLFKLCFKKLFAVCKPFALDVAGQGETTKNFETIAKAHVKQVVQFEKRKSGR